MKFKLLYVILGHFHAIFMVGLLASAYKGSFVTDLDNEEENGSFQSIAASTWFDPAIE